MKKIGIMGGTFNPIHNAHIMMAQAAYEQYDLDEVWFMPSKNPPHKEKKEIASDEHRKRMVQLAIEGISYFRFSEMELEREGTTYTSDTLQQIHQELPDAELYFILGGDSLEGLGGWHEPDTILKHCTILAVPRGHLDEKGIKKLCKKQSDKFNGEIYPIPMNHIQISSEQIRSRLQAGQSAVAFCPDKVVKYIRLHGLYGSTVLRLQKKRVDKELLACLSSTLWPKRYTHTLGVAYTASALAFCHDVEPERAELAGMLHDCAKYFTGEEMLALCREYKIGLNSAEQENTALIHSKLGAYLAKERYGVKDEEILSAICCHTTGKPDMTALEKIIYIADYIEPERHMDCSPYSLTEIRRKSFQDLDSGLLMILTNVVQYLQNSEWKIDEMTRKTYEYYKSLQERRKQTDES